MSEKNYHEILVDLLSNRAAVKQDVYHIMKAKFQEFKELVNQEIETLRK